MEGALSWVKGRCKCPDVGVPPSAAGREAWPKGKKQRRLRGESIREEMGVCVCVCACVRASERRWVCMCVLGEESRLENVRSSHLLKLPVTHWG